MGVMRFSIHPRFPLDQWPEVYRGYIGGMDGRVYPTRIEVDDHTISCRRNSSDSGKLHVAWPIEGFGRPVIHTCSLPERDEPYLLLVELARGKISQLRDQIATWEMAGMAIPEAVSTELSAAQRHFAAAVSSQDDLEQADAAANEALCAAFSAALKLVQSYTEQRLTVRQSRSQGLPASLGCNLGRAVLSGELEQQFTEGFNSALVPLRWRDIEPTEGQYDWDVNDQQVSWCEEHKFHIVGGPLLDLSAEGMPAWLWKWEDDFLNLQSFVSDFVETAVGRYSGRIRRWEVSARANTGGALALDEEHRLTLAARSLEIVRHVEEDVHLMVRVDQPWGEYQARGQHRLSPFQFVDALARSGIGLTDVNLEIAVGFRPRGSGPRDVLDFSRLIDFWSRLGIPLSVTLAFPSTTGPDDLAHRDLEVDAGIVSADDGEQRQAEWVDQFLPVLMAKEAIVGIYWAHFTDAVPHRFPHAGLIRPDGTAKPALDHVRVYRKEYW